MSVPTWIVAVAGSLLSHGVLMTGVYLVPPTGGSPVSPRVGFGALGGAEPAPIYLLPEDFTGDAAAAARTEPGVIAPEVPALVLVTPPSAATERRPEMEPVPMRLGSEDGPKIDTKVWLASKGEGEQGGMESTIEQPKLDRVDAPVPPVAGGANGQQGQQGQAGRKEPQGQPSQSPSKGTAGPAGDVPAQISVAPKGESPAADAKRPAGAVDQRPTEGESSSERPAVEKELLPAAGTDGGARPEQIGEDSERVERVAAGAPVAAPVVTPAPASMPQPAAVAGGATGSQGAERAGPGAPGAPGAAGEPAKVASDRDSDAATVRRAAVFRNGKIEAGEGLDVRTVRPEFSLSTRALRRPGNPVLELVFGKDGRVRSVRVVKSSGYAEDVDGPVVSALYNWRAKGRVLDALPARPDATVSLQITVILQ